MKIQESSLQLQASHEAKRTHKVEVTSAVARDRLVAALTKVGYAPA